MKTRHLAIAVILALVMPARLRAIELSLEENKAERGNIGFVDTQRLFKLFPETIKAKENFEEAVRQAEDQINLRKAEILRLRKELDDLKVERMVVAKSTPSATAPAKPASPPATPPAALPVAASTAPAASTAATVQAAKVSTAAAAAYDQLLKPAVSTRAAIGELPGFSGVHPATATAAQPLIINLPGATTGPVMVSPPAASIATTTTPPASSAAAVAVSSAAASAPAPDAIDAAIAALDEKIAQKTRELDRKQTQAKDEQSAAEKDLLDLESRKSEILLGKIYKAVQDVAHREGVSVVVDKSGILYGHNAVDLTEKVLKYLKGA